MGHIGLTPQSATMLGGFKAQGRSAEKALELLDDARALEAAGCFSLVLEAVPAPVAAHDHARAHDSHDRHRRGRRLRRPGARLARPARPLRGSHRRGSSSATQRSATRSALRSRPTPTTSASVASPRSSTPTRCQPMSSRSSSRPRQISANTPTIATSSASARSQRRERAEPAPRVDDLDADDEKCERPGDESELQREQHASPPPPRPGRLCGTCRPRRGPGARAAARGGRERAV